MKSKNRESTSPTPLPYIILLLLFMIVSIAALNFNTQIKKTSEAQQQSLNSSNFEAITSPATFFYTKIFLDRDRTFISVPLKTQDNPISYPIWVYLKNESGFRNTELLAYHPGLIDLNWPKISTENINLFQKEPIYNSFEDFLAGSLDNKVIYADPELALDPRFAPLNPRPIEDQTSFEDADFILTTFQVPRMEGNISFFETIIDATNAFVNDKNELVWQIKGTEASEDNPFYLGEIHIDYRL
jgi:hypothetical protein